MLQTARRKISYPNPDRTDRPDVPLHILNLATALDADVLFNIGLDSDRLAATHQVGGGRFWWATDTSLLWFDDGSAWQQLGNAPLDSPTFTGYPQITTSLPPNDNSKKLATTEFVLTNVTPPGVIVAYVKTTAPAGWLLCDGSAVSRTTYSALFGIIASTYGAGDGSTTFNVPDLRGRIPVGKNSATFAALAASGGEETHTTTVGEMPSHTHTETAVSAGTPAGTLSTIALSTGNENQQHSHVYQAPNAPAFVAQAGGGVSVVQGSTATASAAENLTHFHAIAAHGHTFTGTLMPTHVHVIANAGGGGSHNNLQPYLVVNYIIKT